MAFGCFPWHPAGMPDEHVSGADVERQHSGSPTSTVPAVSGHGEWPARVQIGHICCGVGGGQAEKHVDALGRVT
jgi:hypothetical protein